MPQTLRRWQARYSDASVIEVVWDGEAWTASHTGGTAGRVIEQWRDGHFPVHLGRDPQFDPNHVQAYLLHGAGESRNVEIDGPPDYWPPDPPGIVR